jgi:hypothetical protein
VSHGCQAGIAARKHSLRHVASRANLNLLISLRNRPSKSDSNLLHIVAREEPENIVPKNPYSLTEVQSSREKWPSEKNYLSNRHCRGAEVCRRHAQIQCNLRRLARLENGSPEKVAADAVQVEPVSTAKFPGNREKNREFCGIAVSVASETVNNAVVTGLPTQIPYSTEQGIILAEQGILAPEQGILPAGIEIR